MRGDLLSDKTLTKEMKTPPLSDPLLNELSAVLRPVRGISALVLGGSRARGTASSSSDYDLGLYYEPDSPLHVNDVRTAVAALTDIAQVTEIGEWGPWINGGAWLNIGDQKVDFLYRDLGQVRTVTAQCRTGEISMNYQPGHPHGFCSAILLGEIALCVGLFDDNGAISELKACAWPFPDELQKALISRFHWEVSFSIQNARLAVHRGEQTHIAGCTYRALACVAQVIFALNRRYLTNEKGALDEASTLPLTITDARQKADRIWSELGMSNLDVAIRLLGELASELDSVIQAAAPC